MSGEVRHRWQRHRGQHCGSAPGAGPLLPPPAATPTLHPHTCRLLLWVLQQAEGQLLLLDEHGVGVGHLGPHLLAEGLQLLLPDHPRVAKPAAVGLDTRVGQLLGLELAGEDAALLVAHRALVVHGQPPHLRRQVECQGLLCAPSAAFKPTMHGTTHRAGVPHAGLGPFCPSVGVIGVLGLARVRRGLFTLLAHLWHEPKKLGKRKGGAHACGRHATGVGGWPWLSSNTSHKTTCKGFVARGRPRGLLSPAPAACAGGGGGGVGEGLIALGTHPDEGGMRWTSSG